ncbi:hypothetical protein M0812_19481 [Anaeramoeba flamelloides]|uniref:UBA domain-containing protein n=1 Tax=Anaeramoeba flamelloides TaxID=1746091 RepID=A0AAV7Z5B3_9EUKA|nr:hypothetical protein M0812_19481 [Anaeramoeba flamelloides]
MSELELQEKINFFVGMGFNFDIVKKVVHQNPRLSQEYLYDRITNYNPNSNESSSETTDGQLMSLIESPTQNAISNGPQTTDSHPNMGLGGGGNGIANRSNYSQIDPNLKKKQNQFLPVSLKRVRNGDNYLNAYLQAYLSIPTFVEFLFRFYPQENSWQESLQKVKEKDLKTLKEQRKQDFESMNLIFELQSLATKLYWSDYKSTELEPMTISKLSYQDRNQKEEKENKKEEKEEMEKEKKEEMEIKDVKQMKEEMKKKSQGINLSETKILSHRALIQEMEQALSLYSYITKAPIQKQVSQLHNQLCLNYTLDTSLQNVPLALNKEIPIEKLIKESPNFLIFHLPNIRNNIFELPFELSFDNYLEHNLEEIKLKRQGIYELNTGIKETEKKFNDLLKYDKTTISLDKVLSYVGNYLNNLNKKESKNENENENGNENENKNENDIESKNDNPKEIEIDIEIETEEENEDQEEEQEEEEKKRKTILQDILPFINILEKEALEKKEDLEKKLINQKNSLNQFILPKQSNEKFLLAAIIIERCVAPETFAASFSHWAYIKDFQRRTWIKVENEIIIDNIPFEKIYNDISPLQNKTSISTTSITYAKNAFYIREKTIGNYEKENQINYYNKIEIKRFLEPLISKDKLIEIGNQNNELSNQIQEYNQRFRMDPNSVRRKRNRERGSLKYGNIQSREEELGKIIEKEENVNFSKFEINWEKEVYDKKTVHKDLIPFRNEFEKRKKTVIQKFSEMDFSLVYFFGSKLFEEQHLRAILTIECFANIYKQNILNLQQKLLTNQIKELFLTRSMVDLNSFQELRILNFQFLKIIGVFCKNEFNGLYLLYNLIKQAKQINCSVLNLLQIKHFLFFALAQSIRNILKSKKDSIGVLNAELLNWKILATISLECFDRKSLEFAYFKDNWLFCKNIYTQLINNNNDLQVLKESIDETSMVVDKDTTFDLVGYAKQFNIHSLIENIEMDGQLFLNYFDVMKIFQITYQDQIAEFLQIIKKF